MRVPTKARCLVVATLSGGVAVLAVGLAKLSAAPHTTLALLAAAVVATELIQIPSDDRSPDPGDAHGFSFSTGVHIAAVILVGPWAAVLVAAFGVLVADTLRGSRRLVVAYNASVFALSVAAGGAAFEALGGIPGTIEFSHDYPALAGLVVVVYATNTILMSAVVALHEGIGVWGLARDAARDGLQSSAAEAGLGVAVARFGLNDPWAIVALAPLVLAVYQAYARLAILRRETARALETFANMVDERDSSTFRHSARVADYVEELAEALEFPSEEVRRLRWAGRLHDLGKIAVDASVLRKPGALDDDEWATMRRHARLSARLLRRFRFAAEEARAVEYHHERADGNGYYGIDPAEMPLAAHFLVVADSFDAMTSDRAYRRGLPHEEALAEIERNLGTQFHPVIGKAFVALQRGEDPLDVLAPEERAALGSLLARPSARRPSLSAVRPELVAAGAIAAALAAAGIGVLPLAAPAVALAAAAVASLHLGGVRGKALARRLAGVTDSCPTRDAAFAHLVGVVAGSCELRWAGLVRWREAECTGSVELEWAGEGTAPTETALTSWLLREAEEADGVPVARGAELGRPHDHLVVPLREGGVVAGYVVLAVAGRTPAFVRQALAVSAAGLTSALLASEEPAVTALPLRATA